MLHWQQEEHHGLRCDLIPVVLLCQLPKAVTWPGHELAAHQQER